jgi:hypothetical protein
MVSRRSLAVAIVVGVLICAAFAPVVSADCGPSRDMHIVTSGTTLKHYGTKMPWGDCRKRCERNDACTKWSWAVSRFGGGCTLYKGSAGKIVKHTCMCSARAGTCS